MASNPFTRPQFAHTDVNTTFGFYGTAADTFSALSRVQVMELYNQMVGMLGGDPNVARQYLDSTAGRHFVDGLTFIVDRDSATFEEVSAALSKSKSDRNTVGFWKRFPRFKPYESTPAGVVNALLENDPSPLDSMVAAISEYVKKIGGQVGYVSILGPEQTAEINVTVGGKNVDLSIAAEGEAWSAFVAHDGEYDVDTSIGFSSPGELISQVFGTEKA